MSRPLSASKRTRRFGEHLFVLPAFLLVLAVVGYPLLYNVDMSLREFNVGNVVTGQAPWVGLENYTEVLTEPTVWRSLLVTGIYTGVSILVSFALGFAGALFFRDRFPGSRILQALLLLGWVLPTVATGTVWRWILEGDYGILNAALRGIGVIDAPVFWLTESGTAMAGVIAATVWVTAPFMMILLTAGLHGIPDNLYEAARIDGAGPWQRFWRITFPIMRPVSMMVLLLSVIMTFKTFDNVFVMTRGGPGEATSVLAIQSYVEAFQFFHYSRGSVITMLLLSVTLLLGIGYLLASRREEKN